MRSTRWASASCEQLHAQMDTILKGLGFTNGTVGERMKAHREGSQIPVRRRRQGPRRDPGVHPGAPDVDPRAAAARVQHARQPEHGSEAAAARRRARRADGVRRRRIDRRQDSRASTGSTCSTTGSAQQVQPRRSDVPRIDSRSHLAGRIHAQDAAHPAAAGVQRLLGRAGRSMRSSWPTSSAPTRTIRSASSATCRRSRSAPAGWWSTPASTPSAGRASRA